jgi:hypothetical protein
LHVLNEGLAAKEILQANKQGTRTRHCGQARLGSRSSFAALLAIYALPCAPVSPMVLRSLTIRWNSAAGILTVASYSLSAAAGSQAGMAGSN